MINPVFREELVQLILKHNMVDTVDGIAGSYLISCIGAYESASEIWPVIDLTKDNDVNDAISQLRDDFNAEQVNTPDQKEVLVEVPTFASEAIVDEEVFVSQDHSNDGGDFPDDIPSQVIWEENLATDQPVEPTIIYNEKETMQAIVDNCGPIPKGLPSESYRAIAIEPTITYEEVIAIPTKELIKHELKKKQKEEIVEKSKPRWNSKDDEAKYNNILINIASDKADKKFAAKMFIKQLLTKYPEDLELTDLLTKVQ